MYNVEVYKDNLNISGAKLRQLKIKRDWMHPITYNCTPVSLANTLGYGVYFEDDISFIWNGDLDTPAEGIIGKEHIWSGRGEGTVSFLTNLMFKTDENTSLLTMPVPNSFSQDATPISTILSTSFVTVDFSVVLKVHTPNKEIFIPAGTDVACILPISIGQFQDSTITIHEDVWPYGSIQNSQPYLKYLKDAMANGENPKMYKKAIDHNGNKIGKHEVDRLNMNIVYKGEKK
jgi:hypothetical protein